MRNAQRKAWHAIKWKTSFRQDNLKGKKPRQWSSKVHPNTSGKLAGKQAINSHWYYPKHSKTENEQTKVGKVPLFKTDFTQPRIVKTLEN